MAGKNGLCHFSMRPFFRMKSSFAPLCLGDLKSKKGWLLKNHHDGRILTNGGECKKTKGEE
ncbi:hypothetical protein GTID1_00930 [Geobacillus thermodenitrificans]|nr:hypothetical protein GTID1_00930 [Geobacillus thermodenitrificans]